MQPREKAVQQKAADDPLTVANGVISGGVGMTDEHLLAGLKESEKNCHHKRPGNKPRKPKNKKHMQCHNSRCNWTAVSCLDIQLLTVAFIID